MAAQYNLIRVFADQGVALLPLWKEMDWSLDTDISEKYIEQIGKEMKRMVVTYPDYLKAPRRFAALSDKEIVVLKFIAQGFNNTQIAKELNISLGTAKFHASNIMKKLDAENRTVAVKIAQEEGIL